MGNLPQPSANILRALRKGLVIPAHPLALTSARRLDEKHQRALTRYYLDAGAGGVAVAVHSTQFEIRNPEVGLLKPVLELASEEADRFTQKAGFPIVKIAGVIGATEQALSEARLASDLGYHSVLLSLAKLKNASNAELIRHCRAVAEVMPLVGFYLQPAVGGRLLDVDFWREFCQIENVVAIKMAPFNRYQTLDVLRGVAESGRGDSIALYTGNDDNIIMDLITPYVFKTGEKELTLRIVGGLLGHWAVWTKRSVEQLKMIHETLEHSHSVPTSILTLAQRVTDANSAFFDAAHNFAGCIIGLHYVLQRQGLMQGLWTLDSAVELSPQQRAEIDRVYQAYPDLNDDAFVAENLERWLK